MTDFPVKLPVFYLVGPPPYATKKPKYSGTQPSCFPGSLFIIICGNVILSASALPLGLTYQMTYGWGQDCYLWLPAN